MTAALAPLQERASSKGGRVSRKGAEPAPRHAFDLSGMHQRGGNRATGQLIQRLATRGPSIQRCACGGTCASCAQHDEDEEQLVQRLRANDIQPKLTINAIGDRYEVEADRVADQVMRMPASDPAPHSPPITPLGPSHETAQRDALDEEERELEMEEEDGELQLLQRRASAGAPPDVPPDFQKQLHGREGAGLPLPLATRHYFEHRLGRNLASVRVHRGPEAASMNAAINARAFTHRNHVWLGPGLSTEPSHVLAHELVHVVQQTGAPAVAGRSGPAVSGNQSGNGPGVQRYAPYWEPYDYNGTRTHNEVLPAISRHASVFVEAPVPNADRLSAAFHKKGIADIYDADRTVGVFFTGDQKPARLGASGRLRSDGGEFAHSNLAAPKLGRNNTLTNVDAAPASIEIADLKPAYTIEALEGVGQVGNYLQGFELAAREANEMSGKGKTRPAGAQWNPTTGLISQSRLGLMIPPVYRPGGTGQRQHNLILKQNGRLIRPVIRATGTLVLEPDPDNAGILNYVWVPGALPNLVLPARILAMGQEVTQRIINPLRTGPIKNSIKETFDLGAWRTERSRLRKEFRALSRTPEVQTAEGARLVVEAARETSRATRFTTAAPSAETVATARTMEKIDFWTSRQAGAFGLFRRVFGRTFVRVYQGYERMKERFTLWLRRRSAPTSGGPLDSLPGGKLRKTAIQVAFALLKMAGLWVLNRTVDALREGLVGGLTRKLTAMVPEDNLEELRTRVAEVQQLRVQMQQQAVATAEAIIARVLPNYQEHMDQIASVIHIVGDIMSIINAIKWGIRAISCVSPPALGCIWGIVVTTVADGVLSRVIASCKVQRKIIPHIVDTDFIRSLPRSLAQTIIDGIRALLPEQLHDVFADVTVHPPTADEVDCDTSLGRRGWEPTEAQEAALDMQERLGEERFMALMELLKKSGANPGIPLTRELAAELSQAVESNGWTDLEMRAMARGIRDKPVKVKEWVEKLNQIRDRSPVTPIEFPAEPAQPAPAPQPEPGGGAGGGGGGAGDLEEGAEESPEYSTVVVGTRDEAGGGGDGGDGGQGERGSRIDSRTARSVPTPKVSGERLTGWRVVVATVRGTLAEGQTVHADVRMETQHGGRRVVRTLRDLECIVTEIAPSEDRPTLTEVFLEITEDQQFVFSKSEIYMYGEGEEVVYRYRTASRQVQPKARDGAGSGVRTVSESVMSGIGGGAPLDRDARAYFERGFGHDFRGVAIHTGEGADRSARSINARAFTTGSDIVFADGEYSPRTTEGRRLIAHELTHVVQQTTGSAPLTIARTPETAAEEMEALGIDPRSFAELWDDFDTNRLRGDDAGALALTDMLIIRMSVADSIAHAGDLARWLINHGNRELAIRALDELESAWRIRYATIGNLVPLRLTGGLGSPLGPQELVDLGEREAGAGNHNTARKLLAISHLMIQMMLARIYEEHARTEVTAAELGEAGDMLRAMGTAMRSGEVDSLGGLRARILNVYPALASTAHRAGESERESALVTEGGGLTATISERYTLSDLRDFTNLETPVLGTERRAPAARGRGPRAAAIREPSAPPAQLAQPAAPARVTPPDRVVEGRPPFEGSTALALRANHYVFVRSERYAVSEVLTRAVAWAQNLFGVKSSIVVMHGDSDGVVRYYAAALDEDLTSTFPQGDPLQSVLVEVAVRLESLPDDYHIMAIHVGNGFGFWPSPARLRAYQNVTARERALGDRVLHLEPTLVRATVFGRIDELAQNEEENLEEMARLLAQLDATAFATLTSGRRRYYIDVLLRAWTFQAQERAVVEIMKSVESETELRALIEAMRADPARWEALIDDLDHELWSLLITVGERFGQQHMTVADVYRIMEENGLFQVGLMPGLSIGPSGPEFSFDVLAEIEEAANSFLRFVEGFWDAIVMLVTQPDKIIEGLAQLSKMIMVFKLADMGYAPAIMMRQQILEQFGRQLLNGFKGMALLGVGREVTRRIKWAIIWEIASFFVGVGEIRAVLGAFGASARVGAIARLLRLIGLAGRAAEAEHAAVSFSRLARIMSRSGRVLRTEEEVLVGLSHLPEDDAARLGRALEGIEIDEGMDLARLQAAHPELARLAETSLQRAEVVHSLAAKAGGFSDDVAAAFARMSTGGHGPEELARIVRSIPDGEGQRFVRMLRMVSDDFVLTGPRGAAILELLAQSPSRMAAVERFGFRAVDVLMERAGRNGARLDEYLQALAAIERDIPQAGRAVAMRRLVDDIARGDAEAMARVEAHAPAGGTGGGGTGGGAGGGGPHGGAPPPHGAGPHGDLPEWQEEFIQSVLDDMEQQGRVADREAVAARMRDDIRGRPDDEVLGAFHRWDDQVEEGAELLGLSGPRQGTAHVDVPTQELPIGARERRTAPAAEAVGDIPRARVEVGHGEIQAFRARHPTTQQHTVAAARSNVRGMEDLLEGASPTVRREAGLPPAEYGPIESPSGLAMERFHAEQDIANQFANRADRLRLTEADMQGRTLAIHISNPRGVCYVCRSALENPDMAPGVLVQLSERYPGLTIRVTVDGPSGSQIGFQHLIINSGQLLFH